MLNAEPDFAVYLTFNGNCREAFLYYQHCFGGDLQVQTLADTPDGKAMSSGMQSLVIYASLTSQKFKLVGTDLSDDGRLVTGNRLSILLYCDSFAERARLINKLVNRNFCSYENYHPLVNVTDRFSVNWVLSVRLK